MQGLLDHINYELTTSFGYNNGNSGYIDEIRTTINRKLGDTIYNKSIVYRNANLRMNPFEYRYAGNRNIPRTEGNDVGEAANIWDHVTVKDNFLDDIGGLYGYSLDNEYMFKNTINNAIQPTGWNSHTMSDSKINMDVYTNDKAPLRSPWTFRLMDATSPRGETPKYIIDRDITSEDIFGSDMSDLISKSRSSEFSSFLPGSFNGKENTYQYYQENYENTPNSVKTFNHANESLSDESKVNMLAEEWSESELEKQKFVTYN